MTDEMLARLERLINERHTHMVDATTAIIGGLHEDLIGLGQGQENLAEQIAALGRSLETAIRERNDALEMVHDQMRRIQTRQDELQHQIDMLGRRIDVHDHLVGLGRLSDAPGD